MTQSRLIVVEGVAGAGKSTLARYVGDLLKARGAPHHVIVEGDLDHPADYESVTWLPEPSYADLLDRHPSDAGSIQGFAEPHDGGLLVPYGRLRTAGSVGASALEHTGTVIDAVSALDPIVVNLYQDDIRATLDRVIAQRPTDWCDFFVSYPTQQEYGRAHQLHGIEGTVQALAARQRLEEELLRPFEVTSHALIDPGWFTLRRLAARPGRAPVLMAALEQAGSRLHR